MANSPSSYIQMPPGAQTDHFVSVDKRLWCSIATDHLSSPYNHGLLKGYEESLEKMYNFTLSFLCVS